MIRRTIDPSLLSELDSELGIVEDDYAYDEDSIDEDSYNYDEDIRDEVSTDNNFVSSLIEEHSQLKKAMKNDKRRERLLSAYRKPIAMVSWLFMAISSICGLFGLWFLCKLSSDILSFFSIVIECLSF